MKNFNDIELKRHYMRNNYFVIIDGKKIDLTDEQIKLLELKSRNSPFDRVKPNERYFYVKCDGAIDEYTDVTDTLDNKLYEISNYFIDEAFAIQVALHQLLYRKLLKFAYDNGCEDTAEWNGHNRHWSIRYDNEQSIFTVYWKGIYKSQEVHFSSEKGASRAIREVVEPFMKEHPDFVW